MKSKPRASNRVAGICLAAAFVALPAGSLSWVLFPPASRHPGSTQFLNAGRQREVGRASEGIIKKRGKKANQNVAARAVGSSGNSGWLVKSRFGTLVATAVAIVARLRGPCHSRFPRGYLQRAQSPFAEVAFGLVLLGALREIVWSYYESLSEFELRDHLFQDMAVAQTYKNSLWPWIQTGSIAVIGSLIAVWAVKSFVKSMKDWELRQERKEMNRMGDEALFLMSTPIDAKPTEAYKGLNLKRRQSLLARVATTLANWLWLFRIGACVGYLLPLFNVLDFGEISMSLNPYPLGVPASEPVVDFLQQTLKMRYLYKAYLKSGYYFLIIWFLFIQFAVRNKAAPYFVRFHSSQAILISMLLGVPQQIFFALLNPWEAGLVMQKIMYHSMVSIFLFTVLLVLYCCICALMKQTMKLPLVSEAAEMWAGREQ